MRRTAASIASRSHQPWLRRHAYSVRLTSCFLFVALSTGVICAVAEINLIWVANGVLLAYLLLSSRRRWPAYLAVGYAAQIVAGLLTGQTLGMGLLLAALNGSEAFLAALLLRRRSTTVPHFTELGYLIRFACFGVVAAPLASGSAVAILRSIWPHLHIETTSMQWVAADSLGIGIATPVFVAILRGDFRKIHHLRTQWVTLILLAAATIAAFQIDNPLCIFLIFPLLALVLIRMGMEWAAISTLLVAFTGGWCTLQGHGPFAPAHTFSHLDPAIQLQVFTASCVFLLYCISVVLEREQAMVRKLEKIAALHTLVSENSRDAIILADLSGQRSYVSSAAESLGWKPEELFTQEGLALVHPDDQQRAQTIVRELNSGSEGAMIECRVRNRNGDYIWVEASLRVVRDPDSGLPTGVLNIVRDVSERKQAEHKLQEAYNAVEALAVTDALTGLANRRHFDQYLATEWRRSMRDHQPLSLLMLDADKFKAYNDTYGHPRGDNCLKQIAEACMDVVSRPGDLVARYGGEEFVVVLPNTAGEGALAIANEICEALRSRRLPHSGNAPGIVTVSAGCATLIPRFGKHAPELVEMADCALYRAKANGRNQACTYSVAEIAAGQLPDAVPVAKV
jgi:diguanylate cyclase (GGDEF)-like protein/PAS domain S-box-containing protein